MKKIFRNTIAIILLTIGVIGGFIPILQGWIFVLTGFIILDMKKKYELERWLLNKMSKTRLGKKLADLWYRVKRENKDVIEKDKDKKIRNVYRDIHKEI